MILWQALTFLIPKWNETVTNWLINKMLKSSGAVMGCDGIIFCALIGFVSVSWRIKTKIQTNGKKTLVNNKLYFLHFQEKKQCRGKVNKVT